MKMTDEQIETMIAHCDTNLRRVQDAMDAMEVNPSDLGPFDLIHGMKPLDLYLAQAIKRAEGEADDVEALEQIESDLRYAIIDLRCALDGLLVLQTDAKTRARVEDSDL